MTNIKKNTVAIDGAPKDYRKHLHSILLVVALVCVGVRNVFLRP
jgi:hypothetical protein